MSQRFTRLRAGIVAATAALSLAACGGGSPEATTSSDAPSTNTSSEDGELDYDSMTHEELVAAAEEEGSVIVYSFTSRISSVEEAFEEKYPNIDLIGHDISSTEQITRLKSEHAAGAQTADVAYISDAPVVLTQLVDSGILQQYVPSRIADVVPAQYQDPLLANRLSTKILMYNEEAYPNGSPITNLWQLTEDEWNGKVVMVDPLQRGDYLDLMTEIVLHSDAMEEAYEAHFGETITLDDGINNAGEQYIADLYNNGLVLVGDTDTVNAAVGVTGQDDPRVGFTSYSDRRDNEEEGWALQASIGTEPAIGITFPASMGLVAGAENPAAARLVIDFLMGDDSPTGGDAYAPFYVPGDYPVRTDIDTPQDAVELDELGAWDIRPTESAKIRNDVSDFILTLG